VEASAISTSVAAARIGVSKETLLAWERRYGFPRPDRRLNGARAYSERLVSALIQARIWRDMGAPLEEALRRGASLLEDPADVPSNDSLTADVLTEVLDRLDSSVVLMRGGDFQIEFANRAHRRLYPGRALVGSSASTSLTHSTDYLRLATVFERVAATGETLSWSQQRVPMYGEERFWDFSYGRLELRAYEDVRILLQARDVTDAVRKQHETEAIGNEAARRATLHQEGHEAFQALARLVERVAEGDTLSHPGSLALLKSALSADSVMSWTLEGSSWHPVAMTGGQLSDWLLARPGHNDPPAEQRHLLEAVRTESVVQVKAQEMWPDIPAELDALVAFVRCLSNQLHQRDEVLMAAVMRPSLTETQKRLLEAAGLLMGGLGGQPAWGATRSHRYPRTDVDRDASGRDGAIAMPGRAGRAAGFSLRDDAERSD
jgi:DNA-binding transcriptional MerR regulator